MKAPATIRHKGFVYEMTPQSKYAQIIEEIRGPKQDWIDRAWPPPHERSGSLTSQQILTLLRIAACPTPVTWGGIDTRADPGPEFFRPHLIPVASTRVLWHRGMLSAEGKKTLTWRVIKPSASAARYLTPAAVAYQRLWWEAMRDLGQDLQRAWEAYKAAGYRGEAPPSQVRGQAIRERLRETVRFPEPSSAAGG
jgi:hypothetical protein